MSFDFSEFEEELERDRGNWESLIAKLEAQAAKNPGQKDSVLERVKKYYAALYKNDMDALIELSIERGIYSGGD